MLYRYNEKLKIGFSTQQILRSKMKTLNITEILEENKTLKKIIENLEKENKTLLHYIHIFEIKELKK